MHHKGNRNSAEIRLVTTFRVWPQNAECKGVLVKDQSSLPSLDGAIIALQSARFESDRHVGLHSLRQFNGRCTVRFDRPQNNGGRRHLTVALLATTPDPVRPYVALCYSKFQG